MRRLILGFAVVAPLLLIALWPYSPLAGVAVLALSHVLLAYPIVRPNVQWLGPVVTRFRTEREELWLTIDDGPTDDTRAVMDLFARLDVRATFFVKGELVDRFPDLTRELLERGHGVANHSHTHPSAYFWCLPPRAIARQIDDCNRALDTVTGQHSSWFRAPVGMKNPAVHPALRRRGMRLIGWTLRAFDAVERDVDVIAMRITPHLTSGAIIVMHQGREHSLRALERVIVDAQARGFSFVIPTDEQLVC